MEATKYEMTYMIAKCAKNATSEVEKVVNTLKGVDRPISCKELGELIYGEEYKRVPINDPGEWHKNMKARELTARINQVLRHMVREGFVRITETKSEPYTFETEEWITLDENNEPETIVVWDAKGNQYDMPNPRYNPLCKRHGEYRKVQRTATKTIRLYYWAKD
jgi:hypothetical protein